MICYRVFKSKHIHTYYIPFYSPILVTSKSLCRCWFIIYNPMLLGWYHMACSSFSECQGAPIVSYQPHKQWGLTVVVTLSHCRLVFAYMGVCDVFPLKSYIIVLQLWPSTSYKYLKLITPFMECIISFITVYKLPKLFEVQSKQKKISGWKFKTTKAWCQQKTVASWYPLRHCTGNPHILLISVHAGLLKGHMCPGTVKAQGQTSGGSWFMSRRLRMWMIP